MKFVELDKSVFKAIENKLPNSNFYQTVEWADIKRKNGWEDFYVAVYDKKKLLGYCLILARNFLNRRLFYAPRGPVMNYKNLELFDFFMHHLKLFLRKKKGFMFKLDPYIEYQAHDKNGEVCSACNSKMVDKLKNLGFKHRGFTKGYSDEAQFRWSYVLEIKNMSLDELKVSMDQRCRRCIRKADRYPLKIVDVDSSNIHDFKEIMEHTARRQEHYDRSLDYYKSLQDNLKDKVKMVIVYLDRKKYLKEFSSDKMYDKIKKLDADMVPISAGVFILDNDKFNYVYGGTYSYYMSFMAQYKMQVEMIQFAIDKGVARYDFGGISGVFEKGSENYGVYEFKRGFGGHVVEYIGEFDWVIHSAIYHLYKQSFGVYRGIKQICGKLVN